MSAAQTRPAGVLRFVTLNLWGENGPHQRRLDLIGAELERLAPDVVALQEVREVPGRLANQAAQLAARLHGHHAFASATEWGGGSEGLAVVSRFPVKSSAHRRLPHATENEGRMVLSVELAGPFGPLWVHTTHLSYRQHEGRQREEQVLALDAEVTARAAGLAQPQVLLGDFNTVPEADEIRWLCGLTTLDDRRVFYQDAWATARGGEAGVTWARHNPFRARMDWLRADRRIDYIFVTAPRRDGRGAIHGAAVVFDDADAEGVYPSDHFGVMADVQMAPLSLSPDVAPGPAGARTAEKGIG
ncbi:MAG: endonuclease/exonuclease/phosphatase family protein [Myxococcales bacterium]